MTTSWSSTTSLSCASGYGFASPNDGRRSSVTISDLIGTSNLAFNYEGCDCYELGTEANGQMGYGPSGFGTLRCSSSSDRRKRLQGTPSCIPGSGVASGSCADWGLGGVCSCRSFFTGRKCDTCRSGAVYSPQPWCKSGDCRVSDWSGYGSCSVTCGDANAFQTRTRSVGYSLRPILSLLAFLTQPQRARTERLCLCAASRQSEQAQRRVLRCLTEGHARNQRCHAPHRSTALWRPGIHGMSALPRVMVESDPGPGPSLCMTRMAVSPSAVKVGCSVAHNLPLPLQVDVLCRNGRLCHR